MVRKILVWRWLPALLMMAVIFFFSSRPSAELPHFGSWDMIVKKGAHALGYGLLALSYLRGLGREGGHRLHPCLLAWFFAILYSATDEFHQSFVPGRHPSGIDIMIDGAGAAAALAIWLLRSKKKRESLTP